MKKGFTLIELLAVIIILAVVSIIATPMVLDVVSDSKLSANRSNAYSLLDAGKLYYSESLFDTTKALKVNAVTDIYNDITVSGNKPAGGKLYVNKKGNTALSVVIDGKCYIKEFAGELQVLDSETCDLGYVGTDEINPILNISTSAVKTNDWYKENMHMNIKVTDEEGGSGVNSYKYCVDSVECDPNYSVDGDEGSAYITTERINYLCVIGYDRAGNYSTKQCETIKLDKTAPTPGTFNISGTLGSNEWYTSDVTIEANDGTDSLSGHSNSTVDVNSITSNNTGTLITLTTTDVAGNTSNNTMTIKVDKTAPTVNATSESISMVEGTSVDTSTYFSVAYSLSGGNMTCTPTNTNSLISGNQTVTCTATGNNGLVTIANKTIIVTCPYTVGQVFNYNYTGDAQSFTTSCTGNYKMELWGAQGGGYNPTYHGGYGAYVNGNLALTRGTKFYLYVGSKGRIINGTGAPISNEYNGGGGASTESNDTADMASSGGGATDVRLVNNEWNNIDSLNSRIIIAAGGGGGDGAGTEQLLAAGYNGIGGSGGGLIGYEGICGFEDKEEYVGKGGTQISFGVNNVQMLANGLYGNGGGGPLHSANAGGGGGGYYGGASGDGYRAGGGGGSSFISGHNGCDAIAELSTQSNIIHTGQANHYSGKVFTNTKMIDGEGYNWTNVKGSLEKMPNPNGGYYASGIGHTGNGYARITYLGN